MKINVKHVLTEYDGSPVTKTEPDDKTKLPKQVPITLKEVLGNIVAGNINGEMPTAEDLNKRDQIARKIYNQKELDLTLTERTYILERLPKIYPTPRMYGIIRDILDPEANKEEKEDSK